MKLIDHHELSDEDLKALVEWVTGWEDLDPELEIGMVESIVVALLYNLRRRAESEVESAARALGRIASRSTSSFEQALLRHPEWFEFEFLMAEAVPVMLSNRRSVRDKARQIVDLTAVGKALNLETRGKQIFSPTSRIAEELYREIYPRRFVFDALKAKLGFEIPPAVREELESKGAFLPEISRDPEVQKAWWPAIERQFHERFGDQFQDAEVFRVYWQRLEKSDLTGNAKKNEIRKRILKDLRQGLRSLAKSD